MQAEEELNSVTVKHLFQRGTNMASLGKITPSHLASLTGFPTNVFQSLHENSCLKHKTKPVALSLCCQRSGFSQASYIFPCSELWSGKNSRITFPLFAQGSQTSREGWYRVPSGLCCAQALQDITMAHTQEREFAELNLLPVHKLSVQERHELIPEKYFCLGNTTAIS